MNISIEHFLTDDNENTEFIPIISEENDMEQLESQSGDELPLLALRDMVLFPSVIMPITVGRKKSLRLVREAYKKNCEIVVATQKDRKTEDPDKDDLFQMGTVAKIVRILEMPDNSTTVILQGKKRAEIQTVTQKEPYLHAKINLKNEILPSSDSDDDHIFAALVEAIKELALKIVKNSGTMPSEASFSIKNIEHPDFLINFVCSNFGLKLIDKVHLLEIDDMQERGYQLLDLLTKESQLLEIKASIQKKARVDIDKQQREFYLQQQIKTIQDELGGDINEQEIAELKEKAKSKKWNDKTKSFFEKEIKKLERTHPHSPDFQIQMNYVENILSLPWNEYTKDNFDLKRAKKILDKDHAGLDMVKERILEHLAVLKLKKDFKAPIICLYGPPGVGKTSLGKSIAEALNRKYVRMSLGGLHDEAEIRGHRRTYIGALPGRIIQNIQKAGSSNPVFVLDEIDKVGEDFKGDPASALLEVLDPEQNNAFHDNYLSIDFDLSKVLFIATANSLSTISRPLLDRMELIEVNGYILDEKIEIASKHLIPKQIEEHGIEKGLVSFSRAAIKEIIESYTRESGVRTLDKTIAKVVRKIAKKIALEESFNKVLKVEDIHDLLGSPRFSLEKYQGNKYTGVVTGLAWTQVGGEILFIESSLSNGKEKKLSLTGNLGNVMKESAVLALEYIKSNAKKFGIDSDIFEEQNIHIHVPEGAIPKDGPSAGITIATALVSALTKRKVKKGIAMTGEITLRGKVLPVGGIREKILAAKRAGITEIILSNENKKDIEEIKEMYIKGLTFHFVSDVEEVIKIALLK
ncbi:MAG: endopeptidase La [Paludibacteraceae bacterium]|nr:endopeptidase La [Paludibacteraceae bacterium]MBO7316976.1 endopeptidase La [Paludibacteraceae bacterium]